MTTLKLFYGLSAILSLVNGVWMLFLPLSWYVNFPAGIVHTGPFNPHFVRDIGVVFCCVALGFGWCAVEPKRSRPVHFGLTLFLTGHALIHVFDILAGHLPSSHWLTDLPTVFLPAIIMIVLTLPFVRERLEH